jgi:nucleotide-binding universal stress UspA family protein
MTRRHSILWWFGLLLIISGPSLAGGATLNGNFTTYSAGASIELTELGPVDWIHWGRFTEFAYDRKAVAASAISDFSVIGESSRKAVRFARDLAKAADLPLNELSVGGVTWSADETLLAAQEVAGDAQVLAVGPGDEPEADQILRVAQHAGLAMIVMGAFPDSWMHQLFFGGTTGQVLRNLNAPVIVIH